jgi:hypothetical protein
MKHQWQVKRTVKVTEDGQKQWDQAYLLVLEIAKAVEQSRESQCMEVNHASSDLCPRIDPASGTSSDH